MAVNLIVIAITCLMTGFVVVWFGPSPSRRRRIEARQYQPFGMGQNGMTMATAVGGSAVRPRS